MSHRQPVRISEIHQFNDVIDARSPGEFALDRIPGAINCPVLNDEERAQIGTIYKQVSPFEAKRLGAAMVSANLAIHLHKTFSDKPASWKPLVYCWRGGLRSGAMVTWLRLVGWDAQQLAGGYKGFRSHVIEQIDTLVPQLQLRVLCGATGSAKTRVLHAMEARGAQVLDLEGYACHKGSLLGNLPGVEQPSQKHFETQLAQKIGQFDLSLPVYVEGESAKIGRISLPIPLVNHLRAAPVIEIDATQEARLAYLLRDYAYLGDADAELGHRLGFLTESLGKEVVGRWQTWANERDLAPLFAELMALHYDPHYKRSQANNFKAWGQRQSWASDDLTDAGIERLALSIMAE